METLRLYVGFTAPRKVSCYWKTRFLCVIIDLFSQKIITYQIDNNQEAPIVEKTFQDAYRKRNAPFGLLFHSDHGSQYTAYSFRKLLRSLNVTQSFSAPGCPYDNAVAEAFFRTIKAEEVARHQYKTEEELRDSVAEYIDFSITADLIKSLATELQVK